MSLVKTAYYNSAKSEFIAAGLSVDAAEKFATTVTNLEKRSFFEDDDEDSGMLSGIGKLLWPALLITGAGLLGYHSGINGRSDRSMWRNIANYSLGTAKKYLRLPFQNYAVNKEIQNDVASNSHKTPL